MNYFFDCEFNDQGPKRPIELISIGIVAEDGRELYLENCEVDLEKLSPWLKQNVVPHLDGRRVPHIEIGSHILNFMFDDPKPVIWGYYVAYDWVLFCQLFDSMLDMPSMLPHHAMDLKQELVRLGRSKPAIKVPGKKHHALADAKWNKLVWESLQEK